jgi:hypothetical protein
VRIEGIVQDAAFDVIQEPDTSRFIHDLLPIKMVVVICFPDWSVKSFLEIHGFRSPMK